MKAYIGLFVTAVLSYLAICTYYLFDENPAFDHRLMNSFRLYTPGMLFTFFILTLNYKKLKIAKAVLYFFILAGFYYVSVGASFTTAGFAVPLVGGLGAMLIDMLFYRNLKVKDTENKNLTITGAIAGLFGLCFYLLTDEILTTGSRFGVIIVSWQLAVGIKCILQNSKEILQSH